MCMVQIGDIIARHTFCHGCRSRARDCRCNDRRSSCGRDSGSGDSTRAAWRCNIQSAVNKSGRAMKSLNALAKEIGDGAPVLREICYLRVIVHMNCIVS